jgi:hypothetical protein
VAALVHSMIGMGVDLAVTDTVSRPLAQDVGVGVGSRAGSCRNRDTQGRVPPVPALDFVPVLPVLLVPFVLPALAQDLA